MLLPRMENQMFQDMENGLETGCALGSRGIRGKGLHDYKRHLRFVPEAA